MRVGLACLADRATVEALGNKLNVSGIFDRIHAQSFPAVHASMALVIRVMFEYEDGNKSHRLAVTLRDADGKEYQKLNADIKAGPLEPGASVSVNQIIEIQGAVFAKPGRYHFGLKADDEDEVRVPLE